MTARIASPARRDLRRRALSRVLRAGPEASVDATVQLCTRGIDAIESYVATYVPSLVLATLAPVVLLAWLALRDPLSAADRRGQPRAAARLHGPDGTGGQGEDGASLG